MKLVHEIDDKEWEWLISTLTRNIQLHFMAINNSQLTFHLKGIALTNQAVRPHGVFLGKMSGHFSNGCLYGYLCMLGDCSIHRNCE